MGRYSYRRLLASSSSAAPWAATPTRVAATWGVAACHLLALSLARCLAHSIGVFIVYACPAGQDGKTLLTNANEFLATEVEVYRVECDCETWQVGAAADSCGGEVW